MKTMLILVLLSLTCSSLFGQKSYYISPKGNDSNEGTFTKPFKSIDKLNLLFFKPGDKILFNGGDTFKGNLVLDSKDAGTPEKPVTVGSYGKGRATILAGTGTAVMVANAGGIQVENLIVKGNGYAISNGSGVSIVNELPDNKKLEFVRVRNVEATGFGRDIFKNKTEVGEQSPQGHGIFVGGHAVDKSKSGFTDVRIDDCVVYENEFYGILITGFWNDNPSTYANENVTIRNCIAHHIHGDPEYMNDHSGSGIFMEDVDGGLIENCVAYENGKNCSNPYGGPSGIWTAVANKVTIQYCESYSNRTNNGNDGDGFDLDGGSTNCIMQYNYSHDNEGFGYLICSYDNAPFTHKNNIVRYNISVNDLTKLPGGAIHFSTGGTGRHEIYDTQVYGNTIYTKNRSAVYFWTKGINNAVFANNVFITEVGPLVQGMNNTVGTKFLNNCYWTVKGDFRVDNFQSLEAWRRETGQEILNGKAVGMFTDPLLVNLKGIEENKRGKNSVSHALSYRLQKHSPLIDAGIDLSKLFEKDLSTIDFIGTPVPSGNGVDIGAFETPVATNGPPTGHQWNLTFKDEFNGTMLDTTKWSSGLASQHEINNDEAGFIPEQLQVHDGVLHIVVEKKPNTYLGKSYQFASGAINSKWKFDQRFGYFEIRIKPAKGHPLVQDFCLVGTDKNKNTEWPPELNIPEIGLDVVNFANMVAKNYPDKGGDLDSIYGCDNFIPDIDVFDDYHTFGTYWDEDILVYYLDGVQVGRCTNKVPYQQNMFLQLSAEFGGVWGKPDPAMRPASMDIDYIRVYQKSNKK